MFIVIRIIVISDIPKIRGILFNSFLSCFHLADVVSSARSQTCGLRHEDSAGFFGLL